MFFFFFFFFFFLDGYACRYDWEGQRKVPGTRREAVATITAARPTCAGVGGTVRAAARSAGGIAAAPCVRPPPGETTMVARSFFGAVPSAAKLPMPGAAGGRAQSAHHLSFHAGNCCDICGCICCCCIACCCSCCILRRISCCCACGNCDICCGSCCCCACI
eukprot:NODE_5550_length_573_cov_178.092664.p2 GENE.NODE_5550_length_573_cov_178.092664~~NODE_5550_length_573_cov_178.092664.p2  ORF type:complete len:162 (+),score=55.71 NODE_5550_length_573_cov_178.092664:36-521(+)